METGRNEQTSSQEIHETETKIQRQKYKQTDSLCCKVVWRITPGEWVIQRSQAIWYWAKAKEKQRQKKKQRRRRKTRNPKERKSLHKRLYI